MPGLNFAPETLNLILPYLGQKSILYEVVKGKLNQNQLLFHLVTSKVGSNPMASLVCGRQYVAEIFPFRPPGKSRTYLQKGLC